MNSHPKPIARTQRCLRTGLVSSACLLLVAGLTFGCSGGDDEQISPTGGRGGTSASGGSGGSAAGSGGSSGSSGASGAGGAAGGSGGTAGAAGTGGTAGSGGSGGTAGTGGTGGTAGSGGSAGTGGGTWITPGDPGTSDIQFEVDTSADVHPISPYIYGTNQPDWNGGARNLTLSRAGGNRWTAYNWENNASNAGTDWNNQSDGYLGGGDTPGEAVRSRVEEAHQAGASMLVTIPIQGYVAADKNGNGDVNQTPNYLQARFNPTLPAKGSAFSTSPNLNDDVVYQDEFVSFLEQAFPNARTDPSRTIFYSLDNEPDLWTHTHPRIQPQAVGYDELADKCIAFADAIKGVAPEAKVFGPVNYGWAGFVNLQDAPDANNRDFLEFFLERMQSAETTHGKRLLDVLDVHWYPEAQGDGIRITEDSTSSGVVEARVQAPRSLWDSSYTEDSWISEWSTQGPIRLIPRLKEKIAAKYPGTKLSISEYYYGAGEHISSALAHADALGVFGREDLFAASLWELGSNQSYAYAGFAMFRSFDGATGSFGDTSVRLDNSDPVASSAYASTDAASADRVVIVVINKTGGSMTAGITVAHSVALSQAQVYQLTQASATPSHAADIQAVATNAFSYEMPPMSVSTLVFRP
jgi:Glycoside hydrolase family 44